MPDPVTEPPVTDPVYEALLYCNIPSVAERSMEGRPAVPSGLALWPNLDTSWAPLWGLARQAVLRSGKELGPAPERVPRS